MSRKFICVFVVYCLILCGCSAEKSSKDMSESTSKPNITTANPKEALKMYIEERESTGYTDFGSNIYWSNVIKEKKEEIDYIVNWFKNNSYCETLSFSSHGNVVISPDNKKTIKNEKEFNKIKEFITINKIDSIINNWTKDNEIIILHEFKLEELMGNYCLVYVGSEPKKSEKHYRKIDENYYSDVIFYE